MAKKKPDLKAIDEILKSTKRTISNCSPEDRAFVEAVVDKLKALEKDPCKTKGVMPQIVRYVLANTKLEMTPDSLRNYLRGRVQNG